jgi:hypothetical protein
MLTNILIALGASVAILALVDLFMSERQKAILSNFFTAAWSYLDDLRSLPLVDWVKDPRADSWLAASFSLLVFALLMFARTNERLINEWWNLAGFAVVFFGFSFGEVRKFARKVFQCYYRS